MEGVPEGPSTADPDEAPPTPGAVASSPSASHRVPRIDLLCLLGISATFAVVLTYLGLLRFENFYTTNWDLGINQQLLWSTTQGHLLYESGDAEFFGIRSFLQIHTAYVAFLVVPLYAAAPYPTTLFALQSAAVAASTIPLYLLARRAGLHRGLVLAVIVLYLMSFPMLSATLYDFHWESFVPLEFLTFLYFVEIRRYLWSVVPLMSGVLTLEVFPFLAGGVAVLLLFEQFQTVGLRWRLLVRNRKVQFSVVLLATMGAAYLILRYVQYLVIPGLVGYAGAPGELSHAIGNPFAVGVTWSSLVYSATYWLLMLAALAFLPLWSPRHLILVIPWFTFSVFLTPFFSTGYGDQYSFIALASLSGALVYGAAHVEKVLQSGRDALVVATTLLVPGGVLLVIALGWSPDLLAPSFADVFYLPLVLPVVAIVALLRILRKPVRPPAEPDSTHHVPRWRRPRARMAAFGVVVVVFVSFNAIMSPLNTSNSFRAPYPGYWLKYSANPAASQMGWLTNWIPRNAVVLASDYLFPYVANNPNAWAVPWYPVIPGQPPLYFPFNGSNLPKFVLIDNSDWFNFPESVSDLLVNETIYGLVAEIYSRAWLGSIYLYELGYTGSPHVRYVSVPPTTVIYTAANLTLGPSGRVVRLPDTKFGQAVVSVPVAAPTYVSSCIWFGPYQSWGPGLYTITVNLTGRQGTGEVPAKPILLMTGGPWFLPPLYSISVYSSELHPTGWTNLTWQFYVPENLPLMEFRGYLDYINGAPNGNVTLNYLEVTH